MSETQAILLFWGAVLAGVLLGFLAGWLRGMLWGVAVGCLLIGIGASTAAGSLAWKRWQFVSHSERAEGHLTGYRNGPLVDFTAIDGVLHKVHGLGGSQSKVETGHVVPVRYLAADPEQAYVDDFQNLWGGVLAFSIFGALPLAFGAFFFGLALQESRPSGRPSKYADERSAPLAPWRTRLSSNFIICGNFVMLVGFGFAIFGDDNIGGLGRAFLLIGIGAGLFGLAFVLKREGWMGPAIAFIVALGFVLFGGGAMLLA